MPSQVRQRHAEPAAPSKGKGGLSVVSDATEASVWPEGMTNTPPPSLHHADLSVTRDNLPACYTNGVPEHLPPEVTLQQIIKTMPQEVFKKNMVKAWWRVFVTCTAVPLSIYLVHISPWYLLPFAWALAGTACTGCFVIGHDCGHRSFSRSNLVNDIVGILIMLPLAYPFEGWRIQHNWHHNNTNKLDVDNAWQPFTKEYYDSATGVQKAVLYYIKREFWWFASVGHWVKHHFLPSSFTKEQMPKAMLSSIIVIAVHGVFQPWLIYNYGMWAWFKYWCMPFFLGFHFWLSTFTMIHHSLPHLPFRPESQWNDAEARLAHTVHCEFPWLIEFLCHEINVHVPHHVSTQIPSYNLRLAHNHLKKHWGKYMSECTFSWQLLADIIYQSNLYDPKHVYMSFDFHDELQQKQAAR